MIGVIFVSYESSEDTRSVRSKYLDLEVLTRIAALEMRARHLVEGTLAGLQRSPYIGVSSEFAQHRGYVPGDDTRHIDWKVYARTQRYYVREFQEETNFVVTLLLDASESMRYGSIGTTKLDHACLLAASLSYLVLRQSDAVSLGIFDEELLTFLPPRTSLGSLAVMTNQMERIQPEGKTRLGKVLGLLSEMLSRRGIVVVVSDLLDEPEEIVRGIQRLRFTNQEVVIFHVFDPQELVFEFPGRVRFEGLEQLPQANVDTRQIQADYVALVQDFIHQMRQACAGARADYEIANSAEPVDRLLIRYLSARSKAREGRR
jgi:uncharacterized protein (DUF58 family)